VDKMHSFPISPKYLLIFEIRQKNVPI